MFLNLNSENLQSLKPAILCQVMAIDKMGQNKSVIME
jgi:hypothetical protein